MKECINRIVEASRGFDPDKEATLSEKEAKALLDELIAAAEKKAVKGMDFDEALSAEVLARKMEAQKQGRIQKRNALINIVKQKEATSKIDGLIAEGLDVREAFQALLVGTNSNVKEGRSSIDTKFQDTKGKYFGKLVQDLERENLLPLITQKAMQEQIENELWQLSLKDGKPGVSGSPEAQRIAKIFHEQIEATRIRQNQAGAAIDKVNGFTTTQTHDIGKMWKAGYESWRNTIIKHLDQERTFGDADKESFLKSAYEAITTGIHLKAQGAEQDSKLFQFKGPQNLAKKISERRVFHFKSAEDSRAYRNEFGNRDFIDGVLSGIDHASRNISLMETLGTNPQAMFEKILQDTKAKYHSDQKKIKSITNDKMIHNYYKEVDGTTMMVDSPSLASVSSAIRGLQSMSKLGGVVISSFSDIPSKVAELNYQGRGILESYGISFSDVLQGRGSSERIQLTSGIGVGFDGMLGAMGSRWSSTDGLVGNMAKLQRLFFKLNGLTWWTDVNKSGTSLAMSNNLALNKHLKLSELDTDTQRIFNNYGINEKDWELIRQSSVKFLNGTEHITPDSIHELPDSLFSKRSQEEKNALESKLRGYFIDRANYGTLEPGARERAIFNQGTNRGNVPGELLRLFAQFKQFPTAVITKLYGRGFYGKGKADIPALIHLATMSTVFGYASMAAKDLLKGREPRDPSKAATWGAAFTQGGGAGILGDFLLGEFNRFGQDVTTTLAGPTFSTLNDLGRIVAGARNGDDVKARSVNFLINNAPFANLAYLRPALNYMFIYQLQEQLNPGYLRRMERRVQKENNQNFIIKPSSIR